MKTNPTSSPARGGLGVVLFLVACFASGCVYLRLHGFKEQLAAFPEYFRVENDPRPSLVFLEPILKAGDIHWLFGFEPSSRERAEEGVEREHYDFVKRMEEEGTGHPGERLRFTVVVESNRMKAFDFPGPFAPFLTRRHFMEVFLPIREALVDKGDRQAAWTWADMHIRIPDRATILGYLGTPTLAGGEDGAAWFLYHYDIVSVDHPEGAGGEPDVRILFTFWPDRDLVKLADIRAGRLRMESDLAGEDKLVKVRRE